MSNVESAPQAAYAISAEESRRIQILKLWLSVMVVFIHSHGEEIHFSDSDLVMQVPFWLDWTKYILSSIISNCAVPCFFFLSGIFLYRKPFRWAENVKKKARTLLIPYLFLNTFWIAFFFIAQRVPALSPYFSNPDNIIANYTFSDFANAYLGFRVKLRSAAPQPLLIPLWFMRDLMVLNLLAVLLKSIIDRFPKATLGVLGALLLFNVPLNKVVFCLDTKALVYFSLGYYCVKYDLRPSRLDKLSGVPLAALYLASILLTCFLRGTAFGHIGGTLSIFLSVAFFYKFLTRFRSANLTRRLAWLAQFNFSIYLFHENSLGISRKLFTRFLPMTPLFQALMYFGLPVLIIAFCVAVSVFLKRFEPRFYRLLTGGRAR